MIPADCDSCVTSASIHAHLISCSCHKGEASLPKDVEFSEAADMVGGDELTETGWDEAPFLDDEFPGDSEESDPPEIGPVGELIATIRQER